MGGKLPLAKLFDNIVTAVRSLIMRVLISAAYAFFAVSSEATTGELVGPGRFCGYAPIIDLVAGEKVTTLSGGIHAGSFRWEGEFGSLIVYGIGWASPPRGTVVRPLAGKRPARFAQHRVEDNYEIAIWNGAHGAAYFRSKTPFTALQLRAIDRVTLFEEGQTPQSCKLRTLFAWPS
jgi:hypothetical protein